MGFKDQWALSTVSRWLEWDHVSVEAGRESPGQEVVDYVADVQTRAHRQPQGRGSRGCTVEPGRA